MSNPPTPAKSDRLSNQCPLPFRRGLNREQAAAYVGVGTTLFDELVADGRMPKPIRINARTIWDRVALDACLETLDVEARANPFD